MPMLNDRKKMAMVEVVRAIRDVWNASNMHDRAVAQRLFDVLTEYDYAMNGDPEPPHPVETEPPPSENETNANESVPSSSPETTESKEEAV